MAVGHLQREIFGKMISVKRTDVRASSKRPRDAAGASADADTMAKITTAMIFTM